MRLIALLLLLTAALTACGDSETTAEKPAATADKAAATQAYLDELTAADKLREKARDPFIYEAEGQAETVAAAEHLKEGLQPLIDRLEAMDPPAAAQDRHAQLIAVYEEVVAGLDKELAKAKPSTEALGDLRRKMDDDGGVLLEELYAIPVS